MGPSEKLHLFVEKMRTRNVFDVPEWDANEWDITSSLENPRSHNQRAYRILFSEHAPSRMPMSERTALEKAYADLSKAILCRQQELRPKHPGRHAVLLRILRYVYHAANPKVRRVPWRLSLADFAEAERSAVEREEPLSAYKVGQGLEELSTAFDREGLTAARINFRSSLKRPTHLDRLTPEAEARRKEKLPDMGLLEALAQIANLPALAANLGDLVRMRCIELLLVVAFRIGEALTLPADTKVYENDPLRPGQLRLGLRYWSEKGGDPIVKWIPSVAKELVERAIDDIDRGCKSARELARWLEDHPGTVDIGFDDEVMLSKEQAAEILGVATPRHVVQWLRARGGEDLVRLGKTRGTWTVLAGDLKAVMALDRFGQPVVVRPDGKEQTLSQSLFVLHYNEIHGRRGTNWHLAAPLTLQQISDFLGSKTRESISVFQRYDIKAQDGKPLRTTTHAFRHLVNTMALRGGLSDLELARWMGRGHLGDNAAYDHRTAAELAEEARELIVAGKVFGTIADVYRNLPPHTDSQEFLKTHVSAVHMTSLGGCIHNRAEMPCPIATNCLSGCGDYIRVKGDQRSRKALEKLQSGTRKALSNAEAAKVTGKFNAENWIDAQQRVLTNSERALAIDDDDSIADGTPVHLNPGADSLGEAV